MTNFIPDSKPYTITLDSNDMCLSVRCDFYQTCYKNKVSKFYKTQRKFLPFVEGTHCYSFDSGKDSSYKDNVYPKKLVELL